MIGERDFNAAAPVYDVMFVSFRRASMRPARLFSVEQLCHLVYLLLSTLCRRHPSPPRCHPIPFGRRDVPVVRRRYVQRVAFLSSLSANGIVHAYTCSRNNPRVRFLIYVRVRGEKTSLRRPLIVCPANYLSGEFIALESRPSMSDPKISDQARGSATRRRGRRVASHRVVRLLTQHDRRGPHRAATGERLFTRQRVGIKRARRGQISRY